MTRPTPLARPSGDSFHEDSFHGDSFHDGALLPPLRDMGDSAMRNYLLALDRLYRDARLGMLLEDANRRVVFLNRELADILRLGDEVGLSGLVGRPTREVLAEAESQMMHPDSWFPDMDEASSSGHADSGFLVEMADGRFLERYYAPAVSGANVVAHLWVYRDITAQAFDQRAARMGRRALAVANRALADANDDLRRSNTLLQSIFGLQDLLLSEASEREVFERLLEAALEATESPMGFVAEVGRDPRSGDSVLESRAISAQAWDDLSRAAVRGEIPLVFFREDTLLGIPWTTGEPLISNDSEARAHAARTPPGHPALESFLGLPIIVRGAVVGLIGLANREGGYDEQMVEWLGPFTATCASAFSHLRSRRERSTVMDRLREATLRAEEASAAKDSFLSRMSHEVRTPLNGILGFGQLLQMRSESATDRADAMRIVAAGRHLTALIDDVMDLSAIEAGRLRIRPEPTSLDSVIAESLRIVTAQPGRDSDRVTFDSGTADMLIVTDPVRLRQIIINVVENAVKYSAGSIEIVTRHLGERVSIEVIDGGPGIPEELQSEIFEPFWRQESTASVVPGRGLGLPVAQAIAEALGGTLDLGESRPGRTRFRLVVPCEVPMAIAPQARARHPELAIRPQVRGRLLCVEDRRENAEVITEALAHLLPGVEVHMASTGREALLAADSWAPDIVLVDIGLADMDGLDLLARWSTEGLTCYVLTADATDRTRTRAIELGAVEVLVKPVPVDLLADAVVAGLRGG